jgi:Cu-Zn family superoxide dismutase
MKRSWIVALTVSLGALPLSAAGKKPTENHSPRKLTVSLRPTEGNQASGQITFTKEGDEFRVKGAVTGLKPGTEHGFHVHEFGDCGAPDAKSAGGHYNPEGTSHAAREASVRHAGDLGNVTADADGKAEFSFTDEHLGRFAPWDLIGRSVVVHADRDDGQTQPAGNSGDRVACGVIGRAN